MADWKRNPDANCGNCPYFYVSQPEDGDGYCHRQPPIKHSSSRMGDNEDDLSFFFWPDSSWEDHCGEHPDFKLFLDGVNGGIENETQ